MKGKASGEESSLVSAVIRKLERRTETLSIAESCTGGYLANSVTNIPGASQVFEQGFVTYSNSAKTSTLGVPEELLQLHGAVSKEVSLAMALGALLKSGATYALATTGIAGPGGGTTEKPVGTVYIALASKTGEAFAQNYSFQASRTTFKQLVAKEAFVLLESHLRSSP